MLGRVVPHDLRPNVTDRNSIQKKHDHGLMYNGDW